MISESESGWVLEKKVRDRTKKSIDKFSNNQEDILDRHFPKKIKREVLDKWFSIAAAEFFKIHCDRWVRDACLSKRGKYEKTQTIDKILRPVTQKLGLLQHSQVLTDGFLSFMNGDSEVDSQHLMSLGMSMFSSRLIAANIGSDPITIDEIGSSKFMLDTNFIIASQTKSKRLRTSFNNLTKALKAIGVKVVYLHETEEEYKRVIAWFKEQISPLLDTYKLDVLKKAYKDIVELAISEGCEDRADFEKLLTKLYKLPKVLPSGLSISKEDDDELAKVVEKAKKDQALKDKIQKVRILMRPFKKSDLALDHDASLLRVNELLVKRGEKAWILTMDHTLQTMSIEEMDKDEKPRVLTTDTLIQILAANSAGPGLDASDFAPLLANLILNRCMPRENTFTLDDLSTLRNITDSVSELSANDQEKLAFRTTKFRLQGKGADDVELVKEVNRTVERNRKQIDKRLESQKSRAIEAEDALKKEKESGELLRKELVIWIKLKLILGHLVKIILFSLILRVLVVGLAIIALDMFIKNKFPNVGLVNAPLDIVKWFTAIITLFLWMISPIKKFARKMKMLDKQAREKIDAVYQS